MVIFNSYVKLPEGKSCEIHHFHCSNANFSGFVSSLFLALSGPEEIHPDAAAPLHQARAEPGA